MKNSFRFQIILIIAVLFSSGLFSQGIEEQFDSSDFCFIEWPEKIENFLPVNHVTISISVEDDYRIIKFDT